MSLTLSPTLRAEYERLFAECEIPDDKRTEVDAITAKIAAHRADYEAAALPVGVPWHVVAVIHSMEGALSFGTHLHNGDPLTGRTTHVPRGRPKDGQPPYTWAESAADSLLFEHFDTWKDWSLAGTLFNLETYNGVGYRMHHPDVLSPYLWSYSNHYTRGKYVADGRFDPDAVSGQCGGAVLLSRLNAQGSVTLGPAVQHPGPRLILARLTAVPNAADPFEYKPIPEAKLTGGHFVVPPRAVADFCGHPELTGDAPQPLRDILALCGYAPGKFWVGDTHAADPTDPRIYVFLAPKAEM